MEGSAWSTSCDARGVRDDLQQRLDEAWSSAPIRAEGVA